MSVTRSRSAARAFEPVLEDFSRLWGHSALDLDSVNMSRAVAGKTGPSPNEMVSGF